MKSKSGLGRLLLQGFAGRKRKKAKRGRFPSKRLTKRSGKGSENRGTQVLLLSRMQGRAATATATATDLDRVQKEVTEKPLLQEVPAPLLPVPVPVPSSLPVEVHREVVVEPPQRLNSSLTIFGLLRPDDRLRQSIEGFIQDQRSPHTKRAYGKDLKRLVKFLHSRNDPEKIETLNRTVLISYKDSLVSEGLEHTTVDRHLATLKSFFKWLVDDGILDKSPAEGVRFLNPKRLSNTVGFSDVEVKKILGLPDLHTRSGSLHYAILMVLFYCGLRRSELCGLKMSHLGVERNQNVLRLRGKGNAERLIVVIPAVMSAINYYLYITHRKSKSGDDFLFSPLKNNRTGILKKPLDPSMIFYIVTRYARLAGVPNRVSPHSCRATAISNARDHHVPDRAIQEFAGWASPDMITRYDKRKTSVEDSAAHAISYGPDERPLPDLSILAGVGSEG